MTLNVNQLIEQNKKKRKLLTPENNSYYENLLMYIRMNHFSNEKAFEEALLNILNQLLNGQQEGMSAEEVLGSDPEQYADQFIQSLPKGKTKSTIEFGLELSFTFFGWLLILWGIWPFVNKENQTLHLGSLLLSLILVITGLMLIVNVIFMMKNKRKVPRVFGILGGLLFFTGFFLNFLMEPLGPLLYISYFTPFGLGCFLLLASYIMKRAQ